MHHKNDTFLKSEAVIFLNTNIRYKIFDIKMASKPVIKVTRPNAVPDLKEIACQSVPLEDSSSKCRIYFDWIKCVKKSDFEALRSALDKMGRSGMFTHDTYRMMGKTVSSPRLTIAFADSDDMSYTYTGNTKKAYKWFPEILPIKEAAEKTAGHKFTFALVNLYRDGNDYIGYHGDDERNHKKGSKIFSLSIGCTRKFVIIAGADKPWNQKINSKILDHKDPHRYEIELRDGDAMDMNLPMQKMYKHSVPKSKLKHAPSKLFGLDLVRYSITFRYF